MDRQAVPALLAPGVLHPNAQAVGAAVQWDRDKVVYAVDAKVRLGDQRIAVEQRHRGTGLAPHADEDAVAAQHRAVPRLEELDGGAGDERPLLLRGSLFIAAQRRDADRLDDPRRACRSQLQRQLPGDAAGQVPEQPGSAVVIAADLGVRCRRTAQPRRAFHRQPAIGQPVSHLGPAGLRRGQGGDDGGARRHASRVWQAVGDGQRLAHAVHGHQRVVDRRQQPASRFVGRAVKHGEGRVVLAAGPSFDRDAGAGGYSRQLGRRRGQRDELGVRRDGHRVHRVLEAQAQPIQRNLVVVAHDHLELDQILRRHRPPGERVTRHDQPQLDAPIAPVRRRVVTQRQELAGPVAADENTSALEPHLDQPVGDALGASF